MEPKTKSPKNFEKNRTRHLCFKGAVIILSLTIGFNYNIFYLSGFQNGYHVTTLSEYTVFLIMICGLFVCFWGNTVIDVLDKSREHIFMIVAAVCVQTSNPLSSITEVCNKIISIRDNRKNAENTDVYDENLIHEEWTHYCKEEGNFREYADMNIRYLKTTGVIKDAGNGITIDPQHLSLIVEISKHALSQKNRLERYVELCNGMPLLFSKE